MFPNPGNLRHNHSAGSWACPLCEAEEAWEKYMETKRRALVAYASAEEAVTASVRLRNVAFVRGGKFITCTRSYVCDCINDGQAIEVLADHWPE